MQPPKKRPTVLTRLRIDEVSLCDRGAGRNCKVIISKRADDSADDHSPLSDAELARAKYEGRAAMRDQEDMERRAKRDRDDELFNHFLGIFKGTNKSFAAVARGDEADDHDEEVPADELVGGGNDHPADKAADLLVQSGSHKTHEDALAYLLHHPRGAAMLRRLSKSEDSTTMTTPQDKLRDLAKRVGVISIAKTIVEDDNAYAISEHELTALVTECAKRDHPELSEAQAFVKVFTDQSEGGTILRRAFNVVKNAQRSDNVTSYPFPKF